MAGDEETPHLMLSNRLNHSTVIKLELYDGETVLLEDSVELEEASSKTYSDVVDDDSTYIVRVEANDIRSSREWNRGEGLLKARIYEDEIKFVLSMS